MEVQNYTLSISYKTDKEYRNEKENIKNFEFISNVNDNVLSVYILPKTTLKKVSVSLIIPIKFENNTQFYANGYQSWSYSREYKKNEKMRGIEPILSPIVRALGGDKYGDYNIIKTYGNKGVFHSFSHCYIRALNSDKIDLLASIDESNGFTVFTADYSNNIITITKDLEGVELSSHYKLFEIYYCKDNYDTAWDNYFSKLNITPLRAPALQGYTSWYNYYKNINEQILLKDLNALAELDSKANLFQIDDGYQITVGDHLDVDKEKFPNGLKAMADAIHEKNMLAGIWLCPFGATKKSKLFNEHKDWLVCDSHGKPIKVGTAWGGFYAIDFYNPQAKEYLKGIFNTILTEYGFDLVKLDFLYAACATPRYGKSRGEIMNDAMQFLRECVGEKLILACGVPLASAFGKVNYCRIGCDMSLGFKHILDFAISREMLSSRKSLTDTIFRRYLNNRAFASDPDVFFIREINCNMSAVQKLLIAKINRMFTTTLLTSDTIGRYTPAHKDIYHEIMTRSDYKITSVNILYKNTVRIDYTKNGEQRLLIFDLKTSEIYRKSR